MEKYLQEAFKAFDEIDTLNEDVFDISVNDGLDKAKEFEEEPVYDDREEEIIIDPLAETEEDLQKDYLGKAILQCEICQSMVYKDPSEVIIDEESELANLEDICPFCQSQDGFKVIGEIKEFCDDEECEKHPEDCDCEECKEKQDVELESEDSIDESIKTRKKVRVEESSERDDIDADADDKKEKAKKEFEKSIDDADSDRDYKLKRANLKESDKPAAISMEDAQKWVDFDMKRYGKISERTNRLVKKAGFQIIKDDHGDYEVTAGKFESCEEALKEDFEKVDIETDTQKMSMESDENGKVTVTTEPKTEEVEETAEVIAPVSDDIKAEFKSSEEETSEEPEEVDYDFDEFEEKDFDSLGEGFLKKVYENVKSFKTTEGKLSGNSLMLEGLITFKSGKQAKTNFVFEAYKATKTGKLKFIGENKQFAKGKKSFTLSGKADGKKLVCESLTYNYVAKSNDGNSKRLYGTIKK